MIYDVYLLQLGFHPMAVAGKLVKKKIRLHTKGETIQTNTKTENMQNRKQTHKTRNKIQRILKT